MKKTLYLLAALLYAGLPLAAQPKKSPPAVAAFDAYVQQAVRDWAVPGLAITVVKDNRVIFQKGYGVRELGKPDPVDAQTLFACASTTKAMTAACMGMLVDEGKVNWDDPVTKHLPDFQLYDPYVTRELKVRDLFLHNSGVGNTDFLWTLMDISSDEILRRMRLVKPVYSLRSSFIYQNVFYLIAGKVIEKVSGQPWETVMRQRIFEPLNMTRTQPLRRLVNDANQTSAHFRVRDTIRVIAHSSADAIAPAGAVWSCVADLSAWVRCMLDSSKYDGGRLLKPGTWAEMLRPQTMVTSAQFYPTQQLTQPAWMTYGLGWFQQDYQGHKLNFHTGSLDGAIALHGQMPDQKIGVFILGNLDHAELRHALLYKTLDYFALGGTRDWSAECRRLYGQMAANIRQAEQTVKSQRVADTRPLISDGALVGRYTDPLYGQAEVTQKEGQLRLTINSVESGALEHWHYDTYRLAFDKEWYGDEPVHFILNTAGKVASIAIGGMVMERLDTPPVTNKGR